MVRLTLLALLLVSLSLMLVFPRNVSAIGCITTCLLTVETNLPPSVGTVWVLVDGQNLATLPHSFSVVNGTVHTVRVLNLTFTGPSGRDRYTWKQWSSQHTGNLTTTSPILTTPQIILNYTIGEAGNFIAEFEKQFRSGLIFTDATGQPISQPSTVTLRRGSTDVTLTNFTGLWLEPGVWTVTNATWEGVGNAEGSGLSFNSTGGPLNATVTIRARTAMIYVVDKFNNPVRGAVVTTTFANSTTRSFSTDASGTVRLGQIPDGPYTATVFYQGQIMGPWNGDASRSQTLTAHLNIASPPQLQPLISDWWLLAFGFVIGLLIAATARLRRGRGPSDPSDDRSSHARVSTPFWLKLKLFP